MKISKKYMKKNNGFTLVELLAVIVILGLLALITIPTITNVMSKQKENLFYDQLSELIKASQNWATDNTTILANLISKCSDSYEISIDQLKNKEYDSSLNTEEYVSYLSDDFKNPKTKEQFTNDEIKVKVYKQSKNYLYCVDTEDCTDADFDENKSTASKICCDGQEFKERLEACLNTTN